MTNKEAKEKLYMEWQKFLEDNIDYAGVSEAYKMAFKALDEQEPKTGYWILASEVSAYYPCIACDEFGQTWIPSSVVKLKEKSYDGEGFNFNIEEFLRGKEIELDGQKAFIPPRKIIAWMPLPEPYKEVSK